MTYQWYIYDVIKINSMDPDDANEDLEFWGFEAAEGCFKYPPVA